jgi:hypothetical protein
MASDAKYLKCEETETMYHLMHGHKITLLKYWPSRMISHAGNLKTGAYMPAIDLTTWKLFSTHLTHLYSSTLQWYFMESGDSLSTRGEARLHLQMSTNNGTKTRRKTPPLNTVQPSSYLWLPKYVLFLNIREPSTILILSLSYSAGHTHFFKTNYFSCTSLPSD